MNTLTPIVTALMLATALPALAQSQATAPDQTGAVPPPSATAPPVSDQNAAPAASGYGANTAAQVPADQLPPGQAAALAAGDNHLLTNGPVPDTPANRAKYGGPMSHAGRRTAPAGN